MLSLPLEVFDILLDDITLPTLCRLRECNKDCVEDMDHPSLLLLLHKKWALSTPSTDFNHYLLSVFSCHFPFFSPYSYHTLITTAIDEDDVTTFENIDKLRIRGGLGYYHPKIITQHKNNIANYLSQGFHIQTSLPGAFYRISGGSNSFFVRYVVYNQTVDTTNFNSTDKERLYGILLELDLEQRDIEGVKEWAESLSYTYANNSVLNYDRVELHPTVTADCLGPTKPLLLRRYLESNNDTTGRKQAAVAILSKLAHGEGQHLDPYDEEVFSFLSSYVKECYQSTGGTRMDRLLGLESNTFLYIATAAVQYGKVRVLEWIVTTFPDYRSIGNLVARDDTPTSSLMVLRKYGML
jgi:hypothetical protein